MNQEQLSTNEASRRSFAHLHSHSNYSCDGTVIPSALVKEAANYGMTAVALTDHGNLHGAIEFASAANSAGVNAIFGLGCCLARPFQGDDSASSHLSLLAMNLRGFQNLIQISNRVDSGSVDMQTLKAFSTGLICIVSLRASDNDDSTLRLLRNVFRKNIYLEWLPDWSWQFETEMKVLELAEHQSIPLVATNDCWFRNPEDRATTQSEATQSPDSTWSYERCFVSSSQMNAVIEETDALENSKEIVSQCKFNFSEFKETIVKASIPEFQATSEQLLELSVCGLENRYAEDAEKWEGSALRDDLRKRLHAEVAVLDQKSMIPSILLARWLTHRLYASGFHTTNIAGTTSSLVCYALEITQTCPLRFGLQFELFANRQSQWAPIAKINSAARPAQIAKFLGDLNKQFVLAPTTWRIGNRNRNKSSFCDHDTDFALLSGAQADELPKWRHPDCEDDILAWRQHEIASLGGIGLTIYPSRLAKDLDREIRRIEQQHQTQINLSLIPLDDEVTLEAFRRQQTDDIYDFESVYAKKTLQKIQPRTFEALVVANALSRPLSIESGLIEEYISARTYFLLDPVFGARFGEFNETYGLAIFTEQLVSFLKRRFEMQGMEAVDLIRTIVRPVDDAALAACKRRLLGTKAKDISDEHSTEFWKWIVAAAQRSVLKAHCVPQVLAAYQVKYLQCHYPGAGQFQSAESSAGPGLRMDSV